MVKFGEGIAVGEIVWIRQRFSIVGIAPLKEGDDFVGQRLFAAFAQDIQGYFDGKIALKGFHAQQIQPPDKLRGGRIGRVELHKWRRKK